ncbi:MAG: hypothetical protein HOH13_01835 [Crocinitomicaceae bacterium]|jgi:hypothetical protein|nr:hypothetical protein [Crocinitomicaceae bacterium]MBT5404066.1 hypothetical protein [Crocinitomicaceae bacterium]MBT6029018.1 hypothetical protein [Crocinitomicaceae bacterium]MBT6513870.1 hypothetical protein [Crocinitomicaceae bacterium]MDG2330486.1 hypothetical protein [Flavobacteriales bacterium]
MSDEEGFFQLTNYKDHPKNNLYKVFFFREKKRADFFENLLIEKKIPYEKDLDDFKNEPLYLFGVGKSYLSATLECNFLTMAEFRQPLLGANKWFRYGIVIFSVLLLIVALFGLVLSE